MLLVGIVLVHGLLSHFIGLDILNLLDFQLFQRALQKIRLVTREANRSLGVLLAANLLVVVSTSLLALLLLRTRPAKILSSAPSIVVSSSPDPAPPPALCREVWPGTSWEGELAWW